MTGTGQRRLTRRVSSRSNPSRVPSRSIEVSRISPAPMAAHRSAHSRASRPVGVRPPWVKTSQPGAGAPVPGAPATGVHRHHHALAPELLGQLGDQLGPVDGGGVHADLVGPGPEQQAGVLHRADPPADGEGDEDHLGGAGHHVHHGPPVVRGGGDVEEHQLVGALGVVPGGQLHRVPGVEQVGELHALDHPAGVHVEAGDHPDGAHAATPSSTVIRPSTRALPVMAPSRRRPPGPRGPDRRRTGSTPRRLQAGQRREVGHRSHAARGDHRDGGGRPAPDARPSRSGPASVPSRSMAVTTTAATPTPSSRARAGRDAAAARPLPSRVRPPRSDRRRGAGSRCPPPPGPG